MPDEEQQRIDEIKEEISRDGVFMLGPHQIPEKPENGWFAPIVPPERIDSGAAAPFGWGKSKLDAAEDALREHRSAN